MGGPWFVVRIVFHPPGERARPCGPPPPELKPENALRLWQSCLWKSQSRPTDGAFSWTGGMAMGTGRRLARPGDAYAAGMA